MKFGLNNGWSTVVTSDAGNIYQVIITEPKKIRMIRLAEVAYKNGYYDQDETAIAAEDKAAIIKAIEEWENSAEGMAEIAYNQKQWQRMAKTETTFDDDR